MSRTDVTARTTPAAVPAQRSVVTTGTWRHIPSAAPGVLRLRPLAFEATASYVQRLVTPHRLTLPQLLDGAGITLTGHGMLPTADLHLSPAACHHLAALARIPLAHLARARPASPPTTKPDHTAAAARWKRLETIQQPVRACTLCTRQHSQGATDTAWVQAAPQRLMCPRHHQAAPDPRLASPIRTGAVPELAAASYAHQRLLRHPRASTAWTTARAITTRWYDHQQHFTPRWHTRLARLCAANPRLATTGNASPALLTRDLVTYPETVTLASPAHSPPCRTGHTTTPPTPSASSPTVSDCPAWPATRTIPFGSSSPSHAADQHHPQTQAPRQRSRL